MQPWLCSAAPWPLSYIASKQCDLKPIPAVVGVHSGWGGNRLQGHIEDRQPFTNPRAVWIKTEPIHLCLIVMFLDWKEIRTRLTAANRQASYENQFKRNKIVIMTLELHAVYEGLFTMALSDVALWELIPATITFICSVCWETGLNPCFS